MSVEPDTMMKSVERFRVRVIAGAAGRVFFSRVNFLC